MIDIPEKEEVTVYEFDELSEEAQERALERNRYINVEHLGWADFVTEDFLIEAENIGFDIDWDYVEWDFSSPGRGTFSVRTKGIRANDNLLDDCNVVIGFDRDKVSYSSPVESIIVEEAYCDGDYVDSMDELDEIEERVRVEFGVFLVLCREICNELKDSYRQLTSDEAVADTLKVNEYRFLETGEIW